MRSVSLKRSAQLREYSKLRKEFLGIHPWCQFWLHERGLVESDLSPAGMVIKDGIYYGMFCPNSIEVHHKNKRFGTRLNDVSEWLAVGREGHDIIEGNKSWAREKGYLNNF